MRRPGAILLAAAILTVAACSGGERVIVGAGTTLVDSGLMAALEAEYGRPISVVAGSTAEILELAGQGSLSIALVHDESQELAYVADHPGTRRASVFASRFLIVGPPNAVEDLAGQQPADVMATIASRPLDFVSRSDRSGTHARELALWDEAGVTPGGDWYIATGQGMGFTLQVADQRGAFTLVELGAYLAAAGTIDLVPVELGGREAAMANPYHALVVGEAGGAFVDWLTGADGIAALGRANTATFGQQVYRASDEAD